MVTTALAQEPEDCALRALNKCDGMIVATPQRRTLMCLCTDRDLMAEMGWDRAAEGYERARIDVVAAWVLTPQQRSLRRSCRNPDDQES